ncbi:MAG: hypothetical protein ISEC1_P0399 [Thiomicrorhabdus sp.]|nr:MAG: hypothetical protein ISEC1_P0399 [Thiomicrorhabdus sp.]
MKRLITIFFLILMGLISGCMSNAEKYKEVQLKTIYWKGSPIDHVIIMANMEPVLKVAVMDKTFLYVFEDPFEGREHDCVIMALMDSKKIVTDVKYSYCGEEHKKTAMYYGYRSNK